MEWLSEGDEDELDIIQLLNTKKQNKEILSITNAAVNAVASRQQAKPKELVGENGHNRHEKGKENIGIVGYSNSSTSNRLSSESSTAIDNGVNFSGKHKVRVPSRLLREIKSPLKKSVVENGSVLSDEPASTTKTASSLFTSSTSSEYILCIS